MNVFHHFNKMEQPKCKFFNGNYGSCKFGDNCRFAHVCNYYEDNYYYYDYDKDTYFYKYKDDRIYNNSSNNKINLSFYDEDEIILNENGRYMINYAPQKEWDLMQDLRDPRYKRENSDEEASRIYSNYNFTESNLVRRRFELKKQNFKQMKEYMEYLASTCDFIKHRNYRYKYHPDDMLNIKFFELRKIIIETEKEISNLNELRYEATRHGVEIDDNFSPDNLADLILKKIREEKNRLNKKRNRKFGLKIGMEDTHDITPHTIKCYMSKQRWDLISRCDYLNKAKGLGLKIKDVNIDRGELISIIEKHEKDMRDKSRIQWLIDHKDNICKFYQYRYPFTDYTWDELEKSHDLRCESCRESRKRQLAAEFLYCAYT